MISKDRFLYFFLISAILGILLGEILGVILVSRNNQQLLLEQITISQLGYIAVPGANSLSQMQSFTTYLAGGLFFALTIGLGYGIFWGLLFGFFTLFYYKGQAIAKLVIIVFIWALAAVKFQKEAFPFSVHLFLLIFPTFLWFLSLKYEKHDNTNFMSFWKNCLLFFFFLFLLGGLLLKSPYFDQEVYSVDFTQIRNRILLSTTIGQKIDKFYYDYTLYPARVIKPLNNRLQNVVFLNTENLSKDKFTKLQNILKRRDWFPVTSASMGKAETRINLEDSADQLHFYWNKKWEKEEETYEPAYTISYQEFIKSPSKHLKKYSESVYPYNFLKLSCGLSLFIVIPLGLALFLFFILSVPIQRLLREKELGFIKETLLFLGIFLFIFGVSHFYGKKKYTLPKDAPQLWQIVEGEKKGDRLGALNHLEEILTPQSSQAYQSNITSLIKDSNPVVRLFGAQLLAKFPNKKIAIPPLRSLLKDENINVVYTAATSLGKLYTKETKEILLDILQSDQEWYVKMKIYCTLKKKGWRQ